MKNVVLWILIFFLILVISLGALPGSARWVYREVVTNPGTRSEGRIGYLQYGDESLQGYFDEIVIDGQRYRWHMRVNLWDSAGYILDEQMDPEPAELALELDPAAIGLGWYAASHGERRRGTPEHWVWVRRDGLSGYLDPSRIREIADQLGMKPAELDGLPLE